MVLLYIRTGTSPESWSQPSMERAGMSYVLIILRQQCATEGHLLLRRVAQWITALICNTLLTFIINLWARPVCGWHIKKRNPITHTELDWGNSIASLGNEKSILIKEMDGNDFFFSPPSLIVSRLYERLWVSVTTDSVFIEWSNPGSPCCLVHCLSLCSLPIWLSTALQVARTTSPHCYEYDTFRPWLWTTLNEFTTKSTEDCNDIHNLSWVPYSSHWWCISLWVPSIKGPLLSKKLVGVYTFSWNFQCCWMTLFDFVTAVDCDQTTWNTLYAIRLSFQFELNWNLDSQV